MSEFVWRDVAPSTKATGWMTVAPRADGKQWELPVMVVRGAQEGPTLAVFAAVHGDEYEGVEAIPQAFGDVDPAQLVGTLVMVPICNLPAYEGAQRSSPIDGLNLARVFPGKADGTVTERIAHVLTAEVIGHADLLLDLHSGGVAADIPTLIGYLHDEGDLGQQSRAAAEAFGAPLMWGHPLPVPAGRSISAAMEAGIPWLYTEAAGGGFTRADDVAIYRRGILNVMRYLGMLDGAPELAEPVMRLVGDGNLDEVTLAPVGGYFRPRVRVLETVRRGDVLGVIQDFFGEPLAEITAAMDGVVIMVRRIHRVHVGDGLLQITHTLEDYEANHA